MQHLRRPVEPLHRPPVDCIQQRLRIRRNHVDQMQLLRFLIRIGLRILHRILRRVHIAPAQRHVRPQKRQRVVQNLLLHHVIDAAHFQHRMRRTRIRPRRHRRHIRRLHHEESRRPRAAPRGRHIDNHRRQATPKYRPPSRASIPAARPAYSTPPAPPAHAVPPRGRSRASNNPR